MPTPAGVPLTVVLDSGDWTKPLTPHASKHCQRCSSCCACARPAAEPTITSQHEQNAAAAAVAAVLLFASPRSFEANLTPVHLRSPWRCSTPVPCRGSPPCLRHRGAPRIRSCRCCMAHGAPPLPALLLLLRRSGLLRQGCPKPVRMEGGVAVDPAVQSFQDLRKNRPA